MTFKKLPGTKAVLHTIDSEIELLEHMVTADEIEHMINIMVEKPLAASDEFAVHKIHISPCGTPLGVVRDVLEVALESLNEMIGKK